MAFTRFEERLRALKLRKVDGDVDGDRLEVSFEAPSTTFWRGGSVSRFPFPVIGFPQKYCKMARHDTTRVGVTHTYSHQQTVAVAKPASHRAASDVYIKDGGAGGRGDDAQRTWLVGVWVCVCDDGR